MVANQEVLNLVREIIELKCKSEKTCALISCSALQEEQGGLLVNLNAHIYLFK